MTASPVKFTAPAEDFCRALQNAALFASTDKTLPMLTVVHLRMDGGVMIAEATDRYAVAQAMIRDTEGDPGGLLLLAKNAARTAKSLDRITRAGDRVEVSWDPPVPDPDHPEEPAPAIVRSATVLHHGKIAGDTEADIDVLDLADMPAEGDWMAATIDRNWDAHFRRVKAVNAKRGPYWDRRDILRMWQLERLCKVKTSEGGRWRNAEFQHTGHGDPVAVTLGVSFRALLMPVTGA